MFKTEEINATATKSLAKAAEMIKANIQTGPWVWPVRAMMAIYDRQTVLEQNAETTSEDNGVGFNGLDAGILSSFAKQVARWDGTPESQRRFPVPLSEKQLAIARKKMAKYASQLARIARAKAEAKAAETPPKMVEALPAPKATEGGYGKELAEPTDNDRALNCVTTMDKKGGFMWCPGCKEFKDLSERSSMFNQHEKGRAYLCYPCRDQIVKESGLS